MELSNIAVQSAQPTDTAATSSSEVEHIPSRPSSRLGFNRSSGTAPEGVVVPISDKTTTDPSSSPLEPAAVMVVQASGTSETVTPRNDGKVSTATIVEQEADKSESRPPGGSANVPSSAPRKPSTSVSRLCFPFVTTSPRRKKVPASPPPPRHKHSCHPTKLSPYEATKPTPVHERHKYRHRGHSRQALEHIKSLWSRREEERKGEDIDDNESFPPAIPSEPVDGVHPTTHPGRSPSPDLAVTNGGPAPISLHPRRGDISALRDPCCVETDRSLVSIPTWTISKTLWMHDLHLAFEKCRPRPAIFWDDDISDVESELEMENSRSTSYSGSVSDDSEATLFDSETEFDSYDSERLSLKMRTPSSASMSSFVSPATSPSSPPCDFTIKASWFAASLVVDTLTHYPKLTSSPAWATNWSDRWEILKRNTPHHVEKDGRIQGSVLHFSWSAITTKGRLISSSRTVSA